MWKSIRNSVFRFATPCFTFFRNKIILTMIYSFLHLIYSFVSFRFIGFLHSCTFKTQLMDAAFPFFFSFYNILFNSFTKIIVHLPKNLRFMFTNQMMINAQKFQPVSFSTNIFAVFSHNRCNYVINIVFFSLNFFKCIFQ